MISNGNEKGKEVTEDRRERVEIFVYMLIIASNCYNLGLRSPGLNATTCMSLIFPRRSLPASCAVRQQTERNGRTDECTPPHVLTLNDSQAIKK